MPVTTTLPESRSGTKPRLASVRGVEIFAAGEHREGVAYSTADLDQMVENFTALADTLKPPVVIGHEEDQSWLENSGLPSAGRVEKIWRDGGTLKADLADVPQSIARLINGRAYNAVSSEVYDDFEGPDGKRHGKTLRRVALLGGDLPQIKTLADLPLADYGDDGAAEFCAPAHRKTLLHFREKRPSATGTFHVFCEVKTMSAKVKRKRLGKFSEAANKAFLKFAFEKFADGDAEPGSEGTMPEGSAPPPAGVSADDMKKMLLEYGFAADELEGVSETALAAIVRVCKTGMAEKATAPEQFESAGQQAMWAKVSAAGKKEDAGGRSIFDPRSMKGKWAEDAGGANGSPSQVTIKYGEQEVTVDRATHTALQLMLKPITDQLTAASQDVNKFHEDTRRSSVDARWTGWLQAGKVLPAWEEKIKARLLRANAVQKFADGSTEFDLQCAEIDAYPNVVKFAEQVKSGKGGTVTTADQEKQKVQRFAEDQADTLKKVGKTAASFVADFEAIQKKKPDVKAVDYGVPANFGN